MDDMVFQNNNKNTIYVLNTSYNTYGEFGRPNAFGYPQISPDDIYNNPKNCSLSRSLHKFKSLRHHSSEMISGDCSKNTAENNSSSTTYCSPASAALQKLFNCSSAAHSCKSINYRNNNNNCHSNSHLHHDFSQHGRNNNNQQNFRQAHPETGKQKHLVQPHLENQVPLSLRGNSNSTLRGSCVLPCVGGVNGSGKKKHSNSTPSVKSTLIAKKTKFWKYLVEEEKWRKHSVENLSTTNCERDCGRSIEKSSLSNRSSLNETHTMNNENIGSGSTSNALGAINSHANRTNSSSCSSGSSNWSGYADTNKNKTTNSNQKSSAELYKEAAQLLGLACTLCDNCRCLDCQSRYFECDDSDSYSEFSFMDEYYETLQDVDRNIKELHSIHVLSTNLQHFEEDTVSNDYPTSTDLENNVLDHCESFNDLSLENSVEKANNFEQGPEPTGNKFSPEVVFRKY